MKSLITASMRSGWIKLPSESVDIPANLILQQLKPGLPPETLMNQANTEFVWGGQPTGVVLVILLRK